ncbi:hypothetical protein ON010_g8598 [Phytophthora cinnamomi]|nr:hypothetical protein ON010_g8598 [Phytophthora cinnamomi]
MAQTCLHEVLSPYRSSAGSAAARSTPPTTHQDRRDEVTATFLNALFVTRFGAMCVTNVVFGRAYQVYLCDPWPTKWKRVPGYLGSKNLVLGTLFFAAAGVSALSVSSPALRSLCEAAGQIEQLALGITFIHFAFLHFQPTYEEAKVHVKAKID